MITELLERHDKIDDVRIFLLALIAAGVVVIGPFALLAYLRHRAATSWWKRARQYDHLDDDEDDDGC